MAKIDVTRIEGYGEMSPEEKLRALEAYDVPDADYSGYVKKDVFDRTASELAEKKRELREKMGAEEAARLREAEEKQELQAKYEKLLRETEVSRNKAKLVALGYAEALADETAEAMADGNSEKVFANQRKHLDAFERKIRADALKDTPKPVPDGGGSSMTIDTFRKLSPQERLTFAENNPEEYQRLYGKE